MNDEDVAMLVERVSSAVEVETKRRLAVLSRENDRLRGEIRKAKADLLKRQIPVEK